MLTLKNRKEVQNMLYKNRKMSQSEIEEVYEDFVIEIAS